MRALEDANRRAQEFERRERRARRAQSKRAATASAHASSVLVECWLPSARAAATARQCGAWEREREPRAESVRDKPPRADAFVTVAFRPSTYSASCVVLCALWRWRKNGRCERHLSQADQAITLRGHWPHCNQPRHMHCAPRMSRVPTWRGAIEHLKVLLTSTMHACIYIMHTYCMHNMYCMHNTVCIIMYTSVSGLRQQIRNSPTRNTTRRGSPLRSHSKLLDYYWY